MKTTKRITKAIAIVARGVYVAAMLAAIPAAIGGLFYLLAVSADNHRQAAQCDGTIEWCEKYGR